MHDLDRLRIEYADREVRLADSDIYSPFNIGHQFISQQRQRAALDMLRNQGIRTLKGLTIFELGCGKGGILQEYMSYGADPRQLHGADLLLDRVSEAHHRLPGLSLSCADGQYLPYPTASFDLVLQYTVFSSILDTDVKTNLARELVRIVRPGGLILWYDFWLNPTNKQTKGIAPAEIRQLFGECDYRFKRITLAPPIARRLALVSWILCEYLEKLKLFNTHYLAVIHSREASNAR